MDIEEQYDKLYQYCYMKTRHQQTAEDITQETFLRFLEDHSYQEMGKQMAFLYTIARNLCVDYFRQREPLPLEEDGSVEDTENQLVTNLTLQQALEILGDSGRELIFLRYVNEVPIGQLSQIFHLSRFAIYRRIQSCLKQLKSELRKEDFYG